MILFENKLVNGVLQLNNGDEQYTIKLNFKKPDGYWVYGYKLRIKGYNSKNAHQKIRNVITKLMRQNKIEFQLVNIHYC